jgi:hypothetical protein
MSRIKVKGFTIKKDEMESSCKWPNKNLWLEQRTAMHKYLATIFEKLIEENQIMEWLMPGVTIRILKNENIENGKNYRLVTCLLTIHKTTAYLLTYLITYLLHGAESFLGTKRFSVS